MSRLQGAVSPRAVAPAPADVVLEGPLGAALEANLRGRLSRFIVDERSPAIAIFGPAQVACNHEGDWYGEHAGKWLYAAAKAAARSGDDALRANLERVADHLVALQGADGYLGNYAPERRFPVPQRPKPESWDGAPALRTWDVWTHSYLVLGLLEVHRHFPAARYLDAAARIGDLCARALTDGDIDITGLGNHHGMSATVLLDAAVELHFATGERRHLDLALRVLEQAEANPRLALLTRALAGADASEIGTGKAYQLLWNLVGLAKLHRATGEPRFLRAVETMWRNVRDHHLSLGGGPWGGVAHRSREVFNPAGVFDPTGYVETCSTLSWIQLNRELYAITGRACFVEEVERSACNDLLGAQAPDGEDWCYYVFANGRRVHTTYWRCCKSSGAMALEELPALAYGLFQADLPAGAGGAAAAGVSVNLYGPSSATLALPQAGRVALRQDTGYPFDGSVRIRVSPQRSARFPIRVRIPSWVQDARAAVNGAAPEAAPVPGEFLVLEKTWQDGDEIALEFPMPPRLHRRTHRNVQESRAPDGSPVRQQVLRFDWCAITRGPLVYATGLIDGFRVQETVRLPDAPERTWLETLAPEAPGAAPAIRLSPQGRAPLLFSPWYATGARRDGSWRLTWLSLPPDDAP
ncbi:glycoside hydrolase family 127 protein [Luteimonas sp. SJ-92]|uniref:Glycoside hydrolase family 127 protein n=1 Tax=Luteimonas salinisoli TaxID=2752307 RepID=A0A853JCK8_9GAMM|nr:beta-L-arabinofuranosidase domain-containing protein [Luteimonas salinisoli]NZA26320.1 glycoside hydrolase family 127 protein [Luteimonas salinisoli]